MSIGDHSGGGLWTADQGVIDCKDSWKLFDGNKEHATRPFKGERISFIAFAHGQYNKLEAAVVNSMLHESLREVIDEHLTPDEAQALGLRFGMVDEKTRTIREVAGELGVTESAVKHLCFKAFNKLRKPNVEKQLRDYLDLDD